MNDVKRGLPAWKKAMVSARDIQLNELPADTLLKLFEGGEIEIFIDRGLAIKAAAAGLPTSRLTVTMSFLFLPLLLSAPLIWHFLSWVHALATLAMAMLVFRISRNRITDNVLEHALSSPRILDLLISTGTIWFKHVPGSSPTDAQAETLAKRTASLKPAIAGATSLQEPRSGALGLSECSKNTPGPKLSGAIAASEEDGPNSLGGNNNINRGGLSRATLHGVSPTPGGCAVTLASPRIVSQVLAEQTGDDHPDMERHETKEREIRRLPAASVEVQNFEAEIDHSPGLTWLIDETLFIVPISELQGMYALLILRWDDNWSVWAWEAELVVRGAPSVLDAKQELVKCYVEAHLDDADDARRDFLERLLNDIDPAEYFSLPIDHDNYHDVLDRVVSKLSPSIKALSSSADEDPVEVKCELVSYAALYKAKLLTRSKISEAQWSSVASSIENRISSHLNRPAYLSGYEELPDGRHMFISYASMHATHIKHIGDLIRHQLQSRHTDIREIIYASSGGTETVSDEMVSEIGDIFDRAVDLYAATIIPYCESIYSVQIGL